MSLGAFSPFASPAVNLMRLHECSADFKALAAQPSPAERNTQQLEKCMTLLDMILGELVDAPRGISALMPWQMTFLALSGRLRKR